MGMAQKVEPLLTCLMEITILTPHMVDALDITKISNSTLKKRQDIRNTLVPTPPPPLPPAYDDPQAKPDLQ